ncbi:MAG: hypothetical protein ACRDSR_10950 [Pseudonocardiaceae bacterium]
MQRQISCVPVLGGQSQFQIDNARPAWMAAAAAMPLPAGQDRAHLIAFEVIQNDLANILNAMLATHGTAAWAGHQQNLINLCDALFVPPSAAHAGMAVSRTNLINTFLAAPAWPPNAMTRATLQLQARLLLRRLNSSMDNLRPGDAGLNASIGFSVDADFAAGTFWYTGPAATNAAPAPGVIPAGAPPLPPGPAGPGTVMVGPVECILLTGPHEAALYRYQQHSTLALSFVVNGIGGVVNPAAANAQHLSSTTMPPAPPGAVPYSVLVRDPAGLGPHWLYQ